MSTPGLTEQGLDAIRERLSHITPGPWDVAGGDSGHSRFETNYMVVTADTGDLVTDLNGLARSYNERHALDDGGADAYFIAHAPDDVAALLALVTSQEERARAALHLHQPRRSDGMCVECSRGWNVPYPCDTARALTPLGGHDA